MAYQMAAMAVTLNYLEGHSQAAGLCKCNPPNICVAFYTISTDIVLARFLCISRASCFTKQSIIIKLTRHTTVVLLLLHYFCLPKITRMDWKFVTVMYKVLLVFSPDSV